VSDLQPLTSSETADTLMHAEVMNGSRCLSRPQILNIFALKEANPNVTQQQIADAIGCDRSTVSRWLSSHRDTVDNAKQVLHAGALEAAVRVTEHVRSDDPRVSMDASKTVLKAAKLLDDASASAAKVGIVVHIGQPGAPAGPDPLSFQVIDSKGLTT
jgi:transcriptional regulator with XRE-family HTH domain